MLNGRHGDNISKEKIKMHNFQYVSRKQLSPVKKDLVRIINSVQDDLRKEFTFRYDFVGSIKRNMVTYDVGTNIGYDFDVNIQVNDDECKFSAKRLKQKSVLRLIGLLIIMDMIMLKTLQELLLSKLRTGKIQESYIAVILP